MPQYSVVGINDGNSIQVVQITFVFRAKFILLLTTGCLGYRTLKEFNACICSCPENSIATPYIIPHAPLDYPQGQSQGGGAKGAYVCHPPFQNFTFKIYFDPFNKGHVTPCFTSRVRKVS